MNEIKIVKFAELRSKLGAIPGKLIATVLLFGIINGFHFETFMDEAVKNIFLAIVMYGIVSYFWLCVRATGNWIIGIAVALILIVVWVFNADKMPDWLSTLIGFAICFGGVVMDVISAVRYFRLKKSLFTSYQDDYEQPQNEWSGGQESREQEWDEAGQERQQTSQTAQTSSGFFAGCKDEASIKRRYKDLCKVYHPDNGNGSAEIFNKITEEYHKLTGAAAKL